MKNLSPLKLDELIDQFKTGKFSMAQKVSATEKLLYKLNDFPKTVVPGADFMRVRSQILDRISLPQTLIQDSKAGRGWAILPRMLRISSGILGTLLIVVSLTLATAAAALQSNPGDAIYPLKRVVEKMELKLATDQAQQANLQIKFADNRLDELQQVLEKRQAGKLSDQEAQRILVSAVQDLKNSTAAATTASNSQPKVAILTKLIALSNKQSEVLKSASIQSEGEIKAELQKALEVSQISKEQAIKNIERAGLKVEDQPIIIDETNQVTAHGKLTAVADSSISIGSAKFLLTKDTVFINGALTDLKIDAVVDIKGEIKNNKTFALQITFVSENPPTNPPVSQ